MIRKGLHLVYIRPYSSQCTVRANENNEVERNCPKELRDRIVARHRSGQGYNRTSAALKVPKSTVASVILKWNKFGTSRILPRPGSRPAKLRNHGRRASVREVKKNPEITVAELQRLTQPLPGTAPTGHSPTGHSPYRTQPLPDTALPDTAPTGHTPTGHTPTGHSPYRTQPLPDTEIGRASCRERV